MGSYYRNLEKISQLDNTNSSIISQLDNTNSIQISQLFEEFAIMWEKILSLEKKNKEPNHKIFGLEQMFYDLSAKYYEEIGRKPTKDIPASS